jgi:hypothetical protein
MYLCTGGPRNSRTFYLRIRLFAVSNFKPKFHIREFTVQLPRLFAIVYTTSMKNNLFD